MTTNDSDKPKPRRRQYSLRTMFVLLTVLCVCFASLGRWVYWANEQRKVVEWVREMGGSVRYDYDAKPNSLMQLLGVDFFQEVSLVRLSYTQVSDLTPLAKLTSLRRLYLTDTQFSDLTPLAELTSLNSLCLGTVSNELLEKARQALPACTILRASTFFDPLDRRP